MQTEALAFYLCTHDYARFMVDRDAPTYRFEAPFGTDKFLARETFSEHKHFPRYILYLRYLHRAIAVFGTRLAHHAYIGYQSHIDRYGTAR